MRRAKAFAAVVREMPINIAPDELFVSYMGATMEGQPVNFEIGPAVEAVLNYDKNKREFVFNKEDEREFREEILPYWKAQGKYERTPYGHMYHLIPTELTNLFYADPEAYPPIQSCSASAGPRSGAVGHEVVNYEKVMGKGLLGVKKEAEERLASLDDSDIDELKKIPFLKAVIIAIEAAAEIGKRFAAKARELAEKEKSAKRKAELSKIAEACDQVPANQARTFYEALQSAWFTFILTHWESMEARGNSVGRMDQYLYPYYERDIKEGRITKEEAQELIDCWLMKLQMVSWDHKQDGHWFVIGDNVVCHLSVGGYKADGSDATNELSYMFIEGRMHVNLSEPNFSVLVHSKMPEDYLIKGCQLCSMGIGQPMFENSDVIVPSILIRGKSYGRPVTLEDARNATAIGCQETHIVGKDGTQQSGYLNCGMALEFALNNGVSRHFHRKMGLETGDPRQFKSIEEVREAYRKQLSWILEKKTNINNLRELACAEMKPTMFESALLGCIESAIPREAGGAQYNAHGFFALGLPDVADSLAAMSKLIFEENKLTMDQLCDALDNNFEGHDELRQMLLKAPKFGNDDDYVDTEMARLTHEWVVMGINQKNTRGGYGAPGVQGFVVHTPFGARVGALPSGRLAGEPLSNGMSPCAGSDLNGPTAILKSISKVDHTELSNGSTANMSLDPAVFKDGDSIKRLAGLIRALVDEKIFHISINVVSADTLRAAQKEPDKYKGLVVRVAGYTDYFVTLSRDLQDDIIARTENKL